MILLRLRTVANVDSTGLVVLSNARAIRRAELALRSRNANGVHTVILSPATPQWCAGSMGATLETARSCVRSFCARTSAGSDPTGALWLMLMSIG